MADLDDDDWWASLDASLSVGKRLTISGDQLNDACDHIVQLLVDASTLLERGSHATSAFLSITALEETAKVLVGKYRRSTTSPPRSKDPLYKHDQKHKLAAGPTVIMGSRLQDAIGETRMHEIVALARSGSMVRIREAALYVEQTGKKLNVPTEVITRSLARELLLFAVEAFDDALVGYTNHTMLLGERTDTLFERWSNPETAC